jgi:type II secretory pathway component GspD/PulD (secretin)
MGMSLLLWLAWATTLVGFVGDAPGSVGTFSAATSGQDTPRIQMEILIARVDRSALRALDMRFPEAVDGERPTAVAINDRKRFMALLRELRQKNLAVIVAEPVVVTASGRPASLAVPALDIVPHVQSRGRIRLVLDVKTRPAGKGAPGVDSVVVHVRDGQTLALTGLVTKQVTASSTKVPILGDLPLVGRLFSAISYAEVKHELLVLVTPRLVGDH